MKGNLAACACVKVRALGSTAIAIGALAAFPAHAQCAPDFVPSGGQVSCANTDTDGFATGSAQVKVTVQPGATVRGGNGRAAITLTPSTGIYWPPGYDPYAGAAVPTNPPSTVVVNGRVDGTTAPGIVFRPTSFRESITLSVVVGEGGSVTGATSIYVPPPQSSFYDYYNFSSTFVNVDNSGTISGTNGFALRADPGTDGLNRFGTIINRATGTIGAISGDVTNLQNAGLIDGGSLSALRTSSASAYSFMSAQNSGTIRSSAATGTINFAAISMTNTGTLANSGAAGIVLDGGTLTVTNGATGTITAASGTAIRATNQLNLTNAGTVNGNVIVTGGSTAFTSSTIDSRTGTINGNVFLGASADKLLGVIVDGALRTGITGSIDGGAGFDQVEVNLTADVTLGRGASVLPTNFEALVLNAATEQSVTLGSDFALGGELRITGGRYVNNGTITATTRALSIGSSPTGNTTVRGFVNAGTIRTTATGSNDYAIGWAGFGPFDNRGTLTSTGGGLQVFETQLSNSGTITANSTAVRVDGYGGSFFNSGTIRSTAGVGVAFWQTASGSGAINNSGRIEGAVRGIDLRGAFTNGGTIASADTGVGLYNGATLINAAGGTVTGGRRSIGSGSAGSTASDARIVNYGTLNGDVVLANPGDTSSVRNVYFAERGSILNGNLALGRGGTLVTELAKNGPGLVAGITGSIDAADAELIYRARYDTTLGVNPGAFRTVGFDLYDNAKVTLTGLSAARPLLFAGNGTVDLSISTTSTTAPIFIVRTATVTPGTTPQPVENLLLISRGDLVLDRNAPTGATAAVVGAGSSRFTNAGTITVNDRTTGSTRATAIAGGAAVTNSGTIALNGATGISDAIAATNSGRIVQIVGGAAATGLRNVRTIINTGTIDVAGPAITYDRSYFEPLTITNSGRIASSGGQAITLAYSGSQGNVIRNLAGGAIVGQTGRTAILAADTIVYNAGLIDGSVALNTFYSGGSSIYLNTGGTLRGNLLFGFGNDLFVETDGETGVTGTINGGSGIDSYRYRRTVSGVTTMDARKATGFERYGIEAAGADTVVTVEGDRTYASLGLFGTGSIVNKVDVTSIVYANADYEPGLRNAPADLRLTQLAGFTNLARIGLFDGNVGTFVNSGTIGTDLLAFEAVRLSRAGDITFRNDGTIVNSGQTAAVSLNGGGSVVGTNSGTITRGGVVLTTSGEASRAASEPFTLAFNNSGTVTKRSTDDTFFTGAVTLLAEGDVGSGQITLDNSGTIDALTSGGVGVFAAYRPTDPTGMVPGITIRNSGTIRANGGGREVYEVFDKPYLYTLPASAISIEGPAGVTATIANAAGGVIEATGARSSAIATVGAALDITNLGIIRGSAGTVLDGEDLTGIAIGSAYLAGAVQGGEGNDRIVNSGTITGSISLLGGDDVV